MEHDGTTYIFLTARRKAWHHELPDGWKEEAFERFDYTESGVFSKPTASLTSADLADWVEYYGDPKDEFVSPGTWKWPNSTAPESTDVAPSNLIMAVCPVCGVDHERLAEKLDVLESGLERILVVSMDEMALEVAREALKEYRRQDE